MVVDRHRDGARFVVRCLWPLFVAAVVIGCRVRTFGADASADGGAATTMRGVAAPSGDGGFQSLASLNAQMRRPSRHEKRKFSSAKPTINPADPRVLSCVSRYTGDGWSSLRACLEAEAADAGARVPGRYGAAPSGPTLNPAWNVPAWYINPSTGSDNNSGTDAAHPMQHWYELAARRWATVRPVINTNVFIEFLADQPDQSDQVEFRPIMMPGSLLNLEGALTQTASGTLGTVTGRNRATGTLLQADLGAAAAGSVGQLLYNTTRGTRAWVDSLSGTVATLTQPFDPSVTNTAPPAVLWNGGGGGLPAERTNTTTGDSFQLQRPATVSMSVFAPTTIGADTSFGDGILSMMGHIHVPDPSAFQSQSFQMSGSLRISECRVDPFLEMENKVNNSVGELTFNNWLDGGIQAFGVSVFGGSLGTFLSFLSGAELDGDVIAKGDIAVTGTANPTSAANLFGDVYLGGTISVAAQVESAVGEYDAPQAYGTYTANLILGGAWYYDGTASSVFTGSPTLKLDGASTGSALDRSVDPNVIHSNRALSPAQLDATIASGGFGGIAYDSHLTSVFAASSANAYPVPTTLVWAGANGGTGLSQSGCPAGQYLGGTPYACSTPSGTGLTCPVNLASCTTGTLAGTGGGTGLSQSGCPAGQYLGGTPYACSSPPGAGFSCSSLSACTSNQLPLSGLAQPSVSSNLQLLTWTGNVNGAQWERVGGDVGFTTPAPSPGGTDLFLVQGFQGVPVVGGPSTGNSYVYNGTQWVPGSPTGGFAFSSATGSRTIPSTGATVAIGSGLGVQVPNGGGNITVSIFYQIQNPDVMASNHIGDDIVVGVGFNSSTSMDNAVGLSAIARDSSGSNNSGLSTVTVPDFFSNQLRGNYSIFALASSNTQVFTVSAEITALVTK